MKIQNRVVRNFGSFLLCAFLVSSYALAADVRLAWDANTEPDLAGYKVYYGSASRVYSTSIPVGNVTTRTLTGLTPGTYYIAVTALNTGGLESGYSNEVSTTIPGGSVPGISITLPTAAGTYFTANPSLSISGTASDDVAVTQVSWSNNRGGSGNATGTANWSVSGITLQVGANVITVTARDAEGNTGTAVLTATLGSSSDTTPPTVAITAPTSGATYSTTGLTLSMSGTASDNVGVTVVTWVNSRGGSATATGTTSWTIGSIALQSGSNVISVTARDAAGNGGTDTLTVTCAPADASPPTIAITAPTSGATYSTAGLILSMSGTAADNVGVTAVTWANSRGGSGSATGTASWTITGIALQSGSNVITVTARDAVGNTRTATLIVTSSATDSIAPVITITTPTTGTTYSTTSSTLSMGGTASDNAGVTTVTWSSNRGGSGTATGTTNWSIANVPLQSGLNVLLLTASDAAGNAGTATLTVSRTATDAAAPTVVITAPTSAPTFSTTSATLAMGGTASDAVGVTAVTWTNSRGGSGTATGTTSWSIAGITLLSGSNVITITARDAAGNRGTAVLTVTRSNDTTAPTITITSPNPSAICAATATPLTVIGTASDNAGVAAVTWSNSRGGSGTATGTSSWVAYVALQAGSNVITFKAQDGAGNNKTVPLTVSYTPMDTAPPVISGVTNAEISSTSTSIRWTTDKPADSQVDYGATTAYGNSSPVDAGLTTSHSILLTGLTTNTLYHYRVKSRDGAGNLSISNDHTFTPGKGSSAGNRVLTYPRLFTAGQKSPGADSDEYVGVALTNLNATPATLTFTAFDTAGTPLAGTGITNPATRTLSAGQQLPIVDSELFGGASSQLGSTGWIRVESDVDNVAGLFLLFNSTLQELDGANLSSSPQESSILPEIQGQGFTRINITNANAEPAIVMFEILRADGTSRAVVSKTVEGNGALVADVFSDLFAGISPVATDYLRVLSSRAVLPVEMTGRSGQDMALLNGLDPNSSSTVLYAPQYVVGPAWRSTITLINQDNVAGSVFMTFIGEDGTQIGARSVEIPGNGKVFIDDQAFFTPVDEDLHQGYVKAVSNGIRVIGSVTFGDAQGKKFTTALPLVSTLLSSILFGHIASNDIYYTGIALVNPSGTEANASIDLYGADGVQQGSKTLKIPAGRRKSGLMTEFFPELIGQDRTSGYFKVTVDRGVAGYAVFGTANQAVLSAIPLQPAVQ